MAPSPSPRRGAGTLVLAGLLILSGAGLSALKIETDGIARTKVPGASIIYIPSGKFLKFATFGYRALAADAIFLWAIQYYSTPTIDDRFDHLDHVFAIINELDPRYQDPYEVGAMIAVEGARELRAESPEKAAMAITGAFAILHRG